MKMNNKPLNIKIGFYFLITNLVLVLLLGSIFYFSSSSLLIQKEISAKTEAIEKSGNYIELYMSKLTTLSQVISHDKGVYDYLKNKDETEKNRILSIIDNTLSTDPYIKSIILIRKDGAVISNEKNVNMEVSSDMMKEEWYVNSLMNPMPVLNPLRKQSFSLDGMDDWVISVSREIADTNGENLGVLLIDVKYQALHGYLQNQETGKNSDIVILDEDNRIVYYKEIPYDSSQEKYLKNLKNIEEGYNRKENTVTVKYPIKNTHWMLIEISYMQEIDSLKNHFFEMIVISCLASLLITVLISISVLRRITKPIKELEQHMNNFNNDLSKINLKGDVSIEILSLQNHFNEMIDKIKYLREYEINALYSQINPHFLYNTLDTIIWMAEFQDTEKVISITKALSNFFRISLSNGKEKIPLKEEINHIKEYLYIQKQRYEDKLEYKISIQPELENIEVPKIILQPFVENAIYHGIKNLDTTGIISIYSQIVDNKIELIIEDNGIGFEAAKKQALMKMGGVGIKNVNKRIQYYYGNEYGAKIDSSFKTGARIIITLPYK
ncbi:cache domain-containing sensor histidine kinase [Fusobacterium nucleatum]|uniref:cache domain-containing sensor histidine kinase n=1 Tax=Fusobacterium nucleatum TaxID=851 RepID=UPI00235EEEBB|nr:sensor histidine kinase [Fusobacterium nucleatum]WDD88554.1 sensor histidine kinase [Fusobacterium nucleatum]